MSEESNVQNARKQAEMERGGPRVQSTPASALSPARPGRHLTPKMVLIPLLFVVLAGIALYFLIPHRTDVNADRRARPKVVPVTVAAATTQSVPIEIRTTGNVQPYSVVNVVPQVGGQLMKVHFTQGQMVRKGDLLFEIDPRAYQAALAQAQGNVAKDAAQLRAAQANMQRDQANIGQMQANMQKDEASLRYAKVEAQRYRGLVQQGAISMEQADQMLTSQLTAEAQIAADKKVIENSRAVVSSDLAQIETARGTLQADQAAVSSAKLQVEFCTIRSPMDGRTGSLNVYEGNIVTANNPTALVAIMQIEPIYISFTIPEAYLDQVRRSLAQKTLNIQATIEGVKTNLVSGAASFLENTVNTTSGTALLRATFENADSRLYPGQFVDTMVTMPPDGPSIVVPVSAIQTTQKGTAVYVVRNGKADLVPVELKRSFGEFAAIGNGIEPGAIVVTDGQLQLTPGAAVKIVTPGGKPVGGAQQSDTPADDGSGTQPGEGRRHHRRGGGDGSGGGAGGGWGGGRRGGGAPGGGDSNSGN